MSKLLLCSKSALRLLRVNLIYKEVDYECSPGGADESKFTPPAEIKFTDMSAMMQNIPKALGAGNAPKMDKSVCDSITDTAAKAQCMSALTY